MPPAKLEQLSLRGSCSPGLSLTWRGQSSGFLHAMLQTHMSFCPISWAESHSPPLLSTL